MSRQITRAEAIEEAQLELNAARKRVDTWAQKFADDPVYALEWGAAAYEAAADLDVALRFHEALTATDDDGEYFPRDVVAKEMNRLAMQNVNEGLNASSTSASHNLMKKHLGDAWFNAFVREGGFGRRLGYVLNNLVD